LSAEERQRVALITGANRGIGLETARQLAQRGVHVVVGSRDEEKGRRAAKDIEAVGKVSVLHLDVSSSESVQSAVQRFGAISDRLDVLVNNAGVYPDEGLTVVTLPRNRLAETFQTNTFGPLEVTQSFLPYLRRSASARVINISSGYGQLEGLAADVPSYCLSKLALNGLTIMLAEALRSDRVAVNSMCPGWVRTDMGGTNATRSVEEGADTAVWLAEEAPHELTGKFFRNRQEIGW
jgi:NAD(P)-dependent dehydrogenase (short-subunit alcohol dehydrogenase family)